MAARPEETSPETRFYRAELRAESTNLFLDDLLLAGRSIADGPIMIPLVNISMVKTSTDSTADTSEGESSEEIAPFGRLVIPNPLVQLHHIDFGRNSRYGFIGTMHDGLQGRHSTVLHMSGVGLLQAGNIEDRSGGRNLVEAGFSIAPHEHLRHFPHQAPHQFQTVKL